MKFIIEAMKKYLYLIAFFFIFDSIDAQSPVKIYTLEQVVELAKQQSPAAKIASTQKENRYWIYRNYQSNYRPQLSLNGTLPDFNQSISTVTQNDGTDAFKKRSLSTSSMDMSLNQNIGLTGGSIFVSSQLQRIDIMSTPGGTSYLASPAVIGFQQPIFRFNNLRWDKKIEPLKFEESKRQYTEDMEEVALQASDLFFNLLLAQINLEIAEKSLSNTDTLYQISKGRYNLGKIAENDLLQMELSLMNARSNVSQGKLDVQFGTQRLKNFLRISGDEKIKLIEPKLIPKFDVDHGKAIEEAKKNRQDIIEFQRQKIEAERDVARAIGENRLNANLTASFGLTQSSALIDNVYNNPLEQQRFRLGFQMPIVDWGRAKSQIKTAVANKDLIEITISQSEQNFEQEIALLTNQFQMYREKLKIAVQSDTIAQKRYEITMQRYVIGKISILDLNVALEEKIKAKRSYVQALYDFWRSYYELRRKTLYDFENGMLIAY